MKMELAAETAFFKTDPKNNKKCRTGQDEWSGVAWHNAEFAGTMMGLYLGNRPLSKLGEVFSLELVANHLHSV
jgi:hypothetical protein